MSECLRKIICFIHLTSIILYRVLSAEGKYLIMFRNTLPSTGEGLGKSDNGLLRDIDNISVIHTYQIGQSVTFLIENSGDDMGSILENLINKVYVEKDLQIEKFDSCTDYPECTTQSVGDYLWGLGRISHREPNTQNAHTQYTYNVSESVDDVHVYIMDTGIFTEHEDFEGRASWVFTASGIQEEGDQDLNGHGTHVAATIGGRIHGVAKTARLYAVKVLDQYGVGSISGMLESIEFITNQFQAEYERLGERPKYIVNLSLGMKGKSQILESIVQESIDLGIVYVVAAGNDNQDACSWTPAGISDVITVGAVDQSDVMADFSNYGPCVDILAPGVAINSAWIGGEFSTLAIQGTSSAAPHVTGVLVRLMSSQHHSNVTCYSSLVKELSTPNLVEIPGDKLLTPNWLVYVGCNADPYAGRCLEEPVWRESSEDSTRVYMYSGVVAGIVVIITVVCIVRARIQHRKKVMAAEITV